LEGLFSAALLVPWHGAPAIERPENADAKRLARLCVALARSKALLTAWQALALALVEPELREALADTEEIAKLDVVLGNAPTLATWFELPVRSSAATELRAMLDNAVVFPAVQPDSLSQWFDKPVTRLASLASEHLALQLEARGMRALPFVLGVPSSPAFTELAGQMCAQLRRLLASFAEFPVRQSPPSLVDRWIADLYAEARFVGRSRSDVVARGSASQNSEHPAQSVRASLDSDMPPTIPPATSAAPVVSDASLRETVRPGRPNSSAVSQEISVGSRPRPEVPPRPGSIAPPSPAADVRAFRNEGPDPTMERAIDEQWITLAEMQSTFDDPPRVEVLGPVVESALIPSSSDPVLDAPPIAERRASAHLGLAVFAGALAGFAAIAVFTALADRDDRLPELERNIDRERSVPLEVPIVPSAGVEQAVVVPPVAMSVDPLASPTASGVAAPAPVEPAEAPPGSAGAGLTEAPLASTEAPPIASPAIVPKTSISKTREAAH
jgi:hypothetical protein